MHEFDLVLRFELFVGVSRVMLRETIRVLCSRRVLTMLDVPVPCRECSAVAAARDPVSEGPQPGPGPVFLDAADPDAVPRAAALIRAEQVVAAPTDTIYGLAALAQSPSAVGAVYRVKGRHEDKPLAICVGSGADVGRFCRVTVDDGVLRELFPGPVTLIFPRLPILNSELNPGVATVGVRVPDSDFILNLARYLGQPLALTSANLSGRTSALRCDEFAELWPSLAAVVDAGPLPSTRAGSTVIDLSGGVDERGRCSSYRVVRDGCALEKTREVLERYGLVEKR